MRDECIKAVADAAGRTLTPEEIEGIEDRIKAAQRDMARRYRQQYTAMTPEQRLRAAGLLAAQRLEAEAGKARQRVALTIKAHDRIGGYIERMKAKGMSSLEAFDRLLAFAPDRKSDFMPVETRIHAIAADNMRTLLDVFDAIGPKAFGLFANKEGTRAFVHELFGMDSGSVVPAPVAAVAKKAAKAWLERAEAMRTAFNDAGGDVGKREDWRIPQNHAQSLIAKAGKDAWVKTIFPMLKRSEYVHEDGALLNDAEIVAMLEKAWETIATGGANKRDPGANVGRGMLANAHAAERSLHFKDAESYLAYSEKFGAVDIYTTMMEHIHSMARDTATVEVLGPNPDIAARYWIEKGGKEAKLATPEKSESIDAKMIQTKDLYDYMAGKTKPVANRHIAQGFDTLRQWLVATRLGSAAITSITDNATMHLTAAVNRMSSVQLARNQLKTLNLTNSEEKRLARRAGLSLKTFMGEINRWGNTALGPSFSSKMANLTIRASGLNAMTEARRRAFGVTMYGSIGHSVERADTLAALASDDRAILTQKGVTETDFAVWKRAKLEDWGDGNDTMLTPDAIYAVPDAALVGMGDPATLRREAALRLIGMVDEEINMAVIEPGARDKAASTGGLGRGTWRGEIARSFFLFKGFPMAVIARHWGRGASMATAGGRAAYVAAFLAGSTVMGAVAQQLKELAAGRDLRDIGTKRFWVTSLLNGGALGIYGELLFEDATKYGNSMLGTVAGPVAGMAEDFFSLTQGNMARAAQGKETNIGPKLAQMFKNNIPLQNLWYTKAVTDRLWMQNVMEMVAPGYMGRVESRARATFGQDYWWRPQEMAPSRAPEMVQQ